MILLMLFFRLLEGEEYTAHETSGTGEGAEVVAWSERSAGKVHIVAVIAGESIEVLGRHIDTGTGDDTTEQLVGNVVTQFNIGNLPVGCILNHAVAEQVVPGLSGVVGIVGAGNVRQIGQSVFRPAVGIEHGHILVRWTVARVQVVVDTV